MLNHSRGLEKTEDGPRAAVLLLAYLRFVLHVPFPLDALESARWQTKQKEATIVSFNKYIDAKQDIYRRVSADAGKS